MLNTFTSQRLALQSTRITVAVEDACPVRARFTASTHRMEPISRILVGVAAIVNEDHPSQEILAQPTKQGHLHCVNSTLFAQAARNYVCPLVTHNKQGCLIKTR